MKKQNIRIAITLCLIVIASMASWNTLRVWSMSQESRTALSQSNPAQYADLVNGSMKLGLDLKGGVHAVVRVALEEIPQAERGDVLQRVTEIIRNRIDPDGLTESVVQTQGEDRIVIDLPGCDDERIIERLVLPMALLEFKMLQPMEKVAPVIEEIDRVIYELQTVEL